MCQRAIAVTRTEVIKRAEKWVAEKVPYCQCSTDCCGTCKYCSIPDPQTAFRCDCSGYVSHSWGLPGGLNTWTLRGVSHKIEKHMLKPGDVLLNYQEHVIMFNGWTDSGKTHYHALQEPGCNAAPLPPHACANVETYPCDWSPDLFLPYRYNHIVDG